MKDKMLSVVEDLVSSGKSSLNAVEALLEAKATVKGMVAIFTYGFDIAEENFKKANCKLATLSNYEWLIKQAVDSKYVSEENMKSLSRVERKPFNMGENC